MNRGQMKGAGNYTYETECMGVEGDLYFSVCISISVSSFYIYGSLVTYSVVK